MNEVRAGSSSKFTFTLADASGAPLLAAAVLTLTLSLIDVDTDAYLGPWDNRDVKGANGGTLSDGGGTIEIPGPDNAMVETGTARERHIAVLKWTTSNEAGSCDLTFDLIRVHA